MSDPSPLPSAQRTARSMRDSGDHAGARSLLTNALDLAKPSYGEDHPDVLSTAHLLARLHREAGEPAAARRILEEALAAGQRRYGDHDPMLLAISFDLGSVAEELGNRHEARRNFTRVASAGPAALGPDHWAVRAARDYLTDQSSTTAPPDDPVPGPAPRTPAPQAQATAPIIQAGSVTPTPTDNRWAGAAAPDRAEAILPPQISAPTGPPASRQATAATHRQAQAGPVAPRRTAFGEPPALHPARIPTNPMLPVSQPGTAGRTAVGTARRRSGATVAAVAAAIAAVVAAVLAGVAVLRDGGGGDEGGGPAPQTTGTVAVTGKAPTEVRVSVDGTALVVSWADPAAGQVPFLVTGSPPGVRTRLLGEVPAGRTQLRLNGLNFAAGYCVIVAAVYSAEKVGVAPAVCLGPGGAPPTTR